MTDLITTNTTDPDPNETTPDASLTDTEARLLKSAMKLKTQLKDAQAQLAKFDGVDADQLKALLAKADTAETARQAAEDDKLAASGEYSKVRARLEQEHAATVADLKAQISDNSTAVARIAIGAAFTHSRFISENTIYSQAQALRLYADHFDVTPDGSVVGYDAPRGAATRTKWIDGHGADMPFDTALKRIIQSDGNAALRENPVTPGNSSSKQQQISVGAGIDRINNAMAAGALPRAAAAQVRSGIAQLSVEQLVGVDSRDLGALRIAAALASRR